ncbi:MAG: EpsG family protein [Candidatus Brocadiaceae bacterium]|nr:EpsG family protein [Candidatus Brocadiaceae bacterium]
MLVYYICLFIVTTAAYFDQVSENKYRTHWFFIFAIFISMVLVAGLRGLYVGSDTIAYFNTFVKYRTFSDVWLTSSSMEPGYLILNVIVHSVSDQYPVMLVASAIIVVFCYMKAIYKFPFNHAIAFFVFISLGFYTFFFNGVRQGIACAIYSLSLHALIDGKFRRYAIYVIIACLFHKSVIIALPLYFLFRQKTSLKFVIYMVAIAALATIFFDSVMNLGVLISEKYHTYQEIKASGGKLLTLFYLLISIFFLVSRSHISDADLETYDCLLNMLLLGSTIYIVVVFSTGHIEITRVAIFFLIASFFLWPIFFRNIRETKKRQLIGLIFFVGHLVYFYIYLSKIGHLTPYQFNEELIKWFM